MFWVGVSMLVMALTGLGDDTRSFLRFWEHLQQSAAEQVVDTGRRTEVTTALDATRQAFVTQRERLRQVGDCLERLDRSYEVSARQYEDCAALSRGVLEHSAEALIASRARFQAATTEAERARIRAQVLGE